MRACRKRWRPSAFDDRGLDLREVARLHTFVEGLKVYVLLVLEVLAIQNMSAERVRKGPGLVRADREQGREDPELVRADRGFALDEVELVRADRALVREHVHAAPPRRPRARPRIS